MIDVNSPGKEQVVASTRRSSDSLVAANLNQPVDLMDDIGEQVDHETLVPNVKHPPYLEVDGIRYYPEERYKPPAAPVRNESARPNSTVLSHQTSAPSITTDRAFIGRSGISVGVAAFGDLLGDHNLPGQTRTGNMARPLEIIDSVWGQPASSSRQTIRHDSKSSTRSDDQEITQVARQTTSPVPPLVAPRLNHGRSGTLSQSPHLRHHLPPGSSIIGEHNLARPDVPGVSILDSVWGVAGSISDQQSSQSGHHRRRAVGMRNLPHGTQPEVPTLGRPPAETSPSARPLESGSFVANLGESRWSHPGAEVVTSTSRKKEPSFTSGHAMDEKGRKVDKSSDETTSSSMPTVFSHPEGVASSRLQNFSSASEDIPLLDAVSTKPETDGKRSSATEMASPIAQVNISQRMVMVISSRPGAGMAPSEGYATSGPLDHQPALTLPISTNRPNTDTVPTNSQTSLLTSRWAAEDRSVDETTATPGSPRLDLLLSQELSDRTKFGTRSLQLTRAGSQWASSMNSPAVGGDTESRTHQATSTHSDMHGHDTPEQAERQSAISNHATDASSGVLTTTTDHERQLLVPTDDLEALLQMNRSQHRIRGVSSAIHEPLIRQLSQERSRPASGHQTTTNPERGRITNLQALVDYDSSDSEL